MDQHFAADTPFVIRPLGSGDRRGAADVLAAGMRDNPLHVRAFGPDRRRRQRRLRRFLGCAVDHVEREGVLLGAYGADGLVGVLGMTGPRRCRPDRLQSLRCAGTVAASNPPLGTWRVARWLAAWARRDPAEPHWHLGPLAVLPAWRRQGVGGRLMHQACVRLDALESATWLETDRQRNVGFYQAFGFAVVHDEPVLGIRNWFMRRQPSAHRGAMKSPGDQGLCTGS